MYNAPLSQSSSGIACVFKTEVLCKLSNRSLVVTFGQILSLIHLSGLVPRLPDLFNAFQRTSLKSWE